MKWGEKDDYAGAYTMIFDIQKAGFWKRASAFLFDMILTGILAVGFMTLISLIAGYDAKTTALEEAYAVYEERYGVQFDVSAEVYEAFTAEEKAVYDEAYAALIADGETVLLYNKVVNLTLLIGSLGILLAYLVTEFTVPMIFGHGRTLGKKIFGLCVIHKNGVRIDGVALFIRTVLGKYTVETMIPVLIAVMLFFNIVGLGGTILCLILGIAQLLIYFITDNNCLLHDLMAATVVCDYASQIIFRDQQEMVEYKAKSAAAKAAKSEY